MDQYSIFVTAGTLNMPFTRLFNMVERLLDSEQVGDVIVQGIGAESHFSAHPKLSAHSFIEKSVLDGHISRADMIISHAGVGSIVNSLSLMTPTVLVPRQEKYAEHFDDHQLQIFEQMQSHPLFLCCDGDELDVSPVLEFMASLKGSSSAVHDIINTELRDNITQFFTT